MILLATNEVNVDIDGFNTNLKQDDPNYFCVAKKQDYIIVPNSCHIFEQKRYTYQMKNPLTLRIQINIISKLYGLYHLSLLSSLQIHV